MNTKATTQWATYWLETLGCCFLGAAALLAVLDEERGNARASIVGLALTYAMEVRHIATTVLQDCTFVWFQTTITYCCV